MVEVQVVILPFNFQNEKKKIKIKKVEKREKRK
jgi:hypothetical protein